MFQRDLLCIPADGFESLFRQGLVFAALHRSEHLPIAITLEELYRDFNVEQRSNRFRWHRAGKHIAANNDLIDIRLTDIVQQHRLQCRQIRVNVVEEQLIA